MPKARVTIKLDSPEIRKLLKGQEVADFLLDLGNQVASAAGSDYDAVKDFDSRKTRVVVNVIDPRPEAKFIEMRTGRLARALGQVSK